MARPRFRNFLSCIVFILLLLLSEAETAGMRYRKIQMAPATEHHVRPAIKHHAGPTPNLASNFLQSSGMRYRKIQMGPATEHRVGPGIKHHAGPTSNLAFNLAGCPTAKNQRSSFSLPSAHLRPISSAPHSRALTFSNHHPISLTPLPMSPTPVTCGD